jgi:hypothetical protein
MVDKCLKRLSCVFFDDVVCLYRKSVRSWMMVRCWECCHYRRFNRVMLKADEKLMADIDKVRRKVVLK